MNAAGVSAIRSALANVEDNLYRYKNFGKPDDVTGNGETFASVIASLEAERVSLLTALAEADEPYSKERQLARGERRYRRKVASPKQWQAIIAAKNGPCRVCDHHFYAMQYHHLIARIHGGGDTPDNIVPLCGVCHALVTAGRRGPLRVLAESLTDSERAYVVGKLGEDGLSRLFGATR